MENNKQQNIIFYVKRTQSKRAYHVEIGELTEIRSFKKYLPIYSYCNEAFAYKKYCIILDNIRQMSDWFTIEELQQGRIALIKCKSFAEIFEILQNKEDKE